MLKYRQIQLNSNIEQNNNKNNISTNAKNIQKIKIKSKLISSQIKDNNQKLSKSLVLDEKRNEKKSKNNSQIKRNFNKNNVLNISKPYSLSAEKRKIYNNTINNFNETPKIKNFIKPMFILKKKKEEINNKNKTKEKKEEKLKKMINIDINKKNKKLNSIDKSLHLSKNRIINSSFVDKNKIKNIKKNNIIKISEKIPIKTKTDFEKSLDEKKLNFGKPPIPKKIKKFKKNKNLSKTEDIHNKSDISNGINKEIKQNTEKNNNNTLSNNQSSSSSAEDNTSSENESENSSNINKYSYKRNITDISYNIPKKPKINSSNKLSNDLVKIVEFKHQNNSLIKNNKYLRRRSVDNPSVRERLEQYMNNMMLKQNGGNTLFLTNYESGSSYEKEIFFKINEKNIKRKIKISSCTKAGCSGPGIVKQNQDCFFIKENFINNDSYFFIGVCDGHGEHGEQISNFVSNKLPNYITSLSNEEIISNFKKINNEIYSFSDINSDMSGTTVVSIIITPEKLIAINLGDSRLSLFKHDNGIYYSKNLSREHKPCEPDESHRIINSGGIIKKCYDENTMKYFGPERVWLKNKEEPGLAMTRSLGDKTAHNIGVIDEPEIKKFFYDGSEKFIVIASDGLWEYISSEQCINIVKKFYEEEKEPKEAALELTKEAFKRWKRKGVVIDDITIIVIFFY